LVAVDASGYKLAPEKENEELEEKKKPKWRKRGKKGK